MNEFFCSIGQSERSEQDVMTLYCENEVIDNFCGETFEFFELSSIGSIFGKRALLAIDHIMLALFWSYVPNMK